MVTLNEALRPLARRPRFSLLVIVILALGIGATTAIFSGLYQAFLQPLDVPEPERLVVLGAPGLKPGSVRTVASVPNADAVFSYPMFRDLEAAQDVLTGLAAHHDFLANLVYRGDATSGEGALVSGQYFSVLGLQPAIGRLIGPEDAARVGDSPVVVLSHDYWQSRFGGDPRVVGDTLIVNGQRLTVVGVAPEGFFGAMLRSFAELSRVDPGYDASGVLAFRMTGSYAETVDYDRLVQRINSTLDGVATLPGVEGAATAMVLPGVPFEFAQEFRLVEGRASEERPMTAERRVVTPSYFGVMRIPLLAGELCRRPDGSATTEVMVNRSFAERYLPGRSPIGLHVAAANGGAAARIVGVVRDARESGAHREPAPTVYGCSSAPGPTPWFLLRMGGDPTAMIGTVRAKLAELEPARAVYDLMPLERRIGDAFQQNRLRTVLLTVFAVVALSLASLGVYGTLSYVVSRRRREVGLRVALGALRRDIVAQFLGKALRVAALACAAGLALSLALRGVLSGMLYGVSPSDPATLAGVLLTVMAVATLAALLPAVRAARVDPMRTLREE